MRNIKGIIKKEFDKVFKFPRSLFSTLILPGLIIFIIYFAIGQTASKSIKETTEHESRIYVINVSESFYEAAEFAKENELIGKASFFEEDISKLEDLKKEVQAGKVEAVIVFDEGFDDKLAENLKPNVVVYYDSSALNSSAAFQKVQMILEIQKNNYLNEKGIDPNIFTVAGEQAVSEEKAGGAMLGMILPVMILSFIFGSAMGIGADAVAGEKERGTLAKILVLPIPRNQIIIGKIISTTFLTVLAALSSFIGVVASLPFMKSVYMIEGGVTYGINDILLLLVILILLATLASSLLLVTSTIARTIKEASAYSMPIFLAVMVLPMMLMFSGNTSASRELYLLPVYNFILIIKDLLSFNIDIINFLLVVGSSIVTISALVFILIKLFQSEKVLFAQ